MVEDGSLSHDRLSGLWRRFLGRCPASQRKREGWTFDDGERKVPHSYVPSKRFRPIRWRQPGELSSSCPRVPLVPAMPVDFKLFLTRGILPSEDFRR